MKRNKLILFVLFLVSMLIQIMYFKNRQQLYEFGFAAGISDKRSGDYSTSLMYLLVPILFIIFLVSGVIHNRTHGYGKLQIIRHYSKTKLFLKGLLKLGVAVAAITALQALLYIPVNSTMLPLEGNVVKIFIMYFLTLNLVVALQEVLELYIAPHIANIILIIFSYISCFIVQIFSAAPSIRILLFPSLLFGTLNSSTVFENTYYFYLASIIMMNVIVVVTGISKFKKTDIF